MRKYSYWRKLSLEILILLSLFGCDRTPTGHDVPVEVPMPDWISIGELTAQYSKYIGKSIILEAKIHQDSDDFYFVSSNTLNIDEARSGDHRIGLVFSDEALDRASMSTCIGETTIISGIIQSDGNMRVSRAKLKTNALIHKQENCYLAPW